MKSSRLPPTLKRNAVHVGLALAALFSVQTTAHAAHPFAQWTSTTAFRLGNINCTAALGAATNQTGVLLANFAPLDGAFNYPGTWFTPTPPVGTKWSGGNLAGANASQAFTVTCAQAIVDPRLHVVNLDTSKLEVTAPASGVTRLSGNPALVVAGNVVNSDFGVATNGGCDSDPSGGNPNGACGTVQIAGAHTALSFLNSRVLSSGDGWAWTLSAETLALSGTLSGLGSGKTVVLQNNLGDDVTLSADGSFSFDLGNIIATTYSVTVKTQPAGQTCTVTNASGTATAAVTNVTVTCTDNVVQPIPTLSQWVMILLAGLIGLVAFGSLRRRML